MTYAWLISFVCLYYVRVLFCSFYYIALHNKSCLLTHYLNPHKLYLLYYAVSGILNVTSEFMDVNLLQLCQQHLPHPDDLKCSETIAVYLDLKQNVGVREP